MAWVVNRDNSCYLGTSEWANPVANNTNSQMDSFVREAKEGANDSAADLGQKSNETTKRRSSLASNRQTEGAADFHRR